MHSLARLILLAGLTLSVATFARADEPLRFSKSVAPADAADLGLSQLNADQLAVLDALVRQDVSRWDYVSKQPRAARFSARLSATERHNSGLDLLNEAQLSRIDAAVERLMPTAPRGSYAASTVASSSSSTIPSAKIDRSPQIHGSMSFTVGVGSHGYSEIGGGLVLTYDDPASGLGIAVSYSEIHTKGGFGYRGGCFDRYDGFGRYDRLDPFSPYYPGW